MSLSRLTKSVENLDKVRRSQCVPFNKEGLRFNPKNKKVLVQTSLTKTQHMRERNKVI